MNMNDIISAKRDGHALSGAQIQFFVDGVTDGSIPDYQTAALLMAVCIRGMNDAETSALTLSMARSGRVMDLSGIAGVKVDKHSTGGVGDKTTLVAAPLVAACGIPVAKMAGRGLSHTGGTIDKLSALPGFHTELAHEDFIQTVKKAGLGITEAADNLVPADKKLYALRDVTATVDSLPLIASSVMSKKLACGADCILLDVKAGAGAFMKTPESAAALARMMVGIGKKANRPTAALITDMNAPLGLSIGNALELIEVFETLKGRGPKDLELLSVEIAARMLVLAGEGSIEYCRQRVKKALISGAGFLKIKDFIEAQHGDSRAADDYSLLPEAKYIHPVLSPRSGYIQNVKADLMGRAAMTLGAGRITKQSAVDTAAGIVLSKKPGDTVTRGDILFSLHTSDSRKIDGAMDLLSGAVEIDGAPPPEKPLIIDFISF